MTTFQPFIANDWVNLQLFLSPSFFQLELFASIYADPASALSAYTLAGLLVLRATQKARLTAERNSAQRRRAHFADILKTH